MILLLKELRALRPFLWLIILLAMIMLAVILLTKHPDQLRIWDVFDLSDGAGAFGYFIFFAIAFAMGQTLVGGERNESTLEFLDALPVSRAKVYWAKWLAGYLVLSFYLLIGFAIYLPLLWWSQSSSHPTTHPEFWGSMLAMDLLVGAIYLSVGMALGFWGRFGILAAAFWLLGVWILQESGLPGADRFDLLAYGELQLAGSTLLIPWGILLPQLAVAAVLAFIGQLAFESMGRARAERSARVRFATPLFITGLVAATIVWIAAATIIAWNEPVAAEGESAEPVYPDWATSRLRTGHFVFIYPNNFAGAAEELAEEADGIYSRVTQWFGTEPQRELVVDLTSTSPRHAGSAYWGRIRMNLHARGLEERLPAVLGHELCHIAIDQASGNRVTDTFDSTRFFHEGLASYLEYREFRPAEELPQIRRLAAYAHHREPVRFEELASSSALSRKQAPELVYSLGEIFISAVVERFGEEAPPALVRAFDRDSAPRGLSGYPLWQDTFQAAGYDLEAAIAAWVEKLDALVADERDWLDSLPELRGTLTDDQSGYWIGVEIEPKDAIGEGPGQGTVHVRFRSGPAASETGYRSSVANEEGIAWVAREHFPDRRLEFQIGFKPEGDDLMLPLYEPWAGARVP